MQPSDSLMVICLPCLFSLSAYSVVGDWNSSDDQEPQGLTGCFDNMMVSAGGRLRISSHRSPIARCKVLPWGMHKPWAGFNRYKIRSSCRSSPQGHPRSIHPHYLSAQTSKDAVLQETTLANDAYTPPATLDTGPVASGYPGGDSHPLVINSFPVRTCIFCYPTLWATMQSPELPPFTSWDGVCHSIDELSDE